MTWITVLWPMVTATVLTIGLIHLRIGLRRQPGTAHLLFALTSLMFAAYSGLELSMMSARSPEQFLGLQRWADLVGTAGVLSLVMFIRVFFATGRKWLAFVGSGLVCGSQILNLGPEPKLVFLQITGIRTVEVFGGASYTAAEGTRNPWVALFYLGVLFIAAFVSDASVTLWRQGGRRRAVLVGGTTTFFLLAAGLQTWLVDAGLMATPYLVSFFYLAILVAMATELSDEVLRASRLADNLRVSEQRLNLAADAAHLGLWVWDVACDEIWTTPQGRALFGFEPNERLDRKRVLAAVHPDDRDAIEHAVAESLRAGTDFEREYRVVSPKGESRWIAERGQVARDRAGRTVQVRGVAIDITARKEAEEMALSLSGRLIHAQEAERMRLARELHDDLNQSLALLAVELDLFAQNPPTDRSDIAGRIGGITAQIRILSSTVHQISHELHPAKLEQLGLVAAIRGFCRELGAVRNIEIEFESQAVPRELPDDIALCLYRVVQEGLQNVIKHSGAGRALVELTAGPAELNLTISDQGCGFDPANASCRGSLGLVGMRERVRLVHGDISVHSRIGEGTRIRVTVPSSGLIE